MTQSEKQYGIRRTTRLPLEIPVLVSSVDPGVNFSATCQTTLVNAHGCGMISPAVIQIGTQVRIEMESAKRSTTVQVVAVVALGGDPETWLGGLEVGNPGNFWGIEY